MKLRNLIESKLKRGNYNNLSSCRPKLTELPADMQKKFSVTSIVVILKKISGSFVCYDCKITSSILGLMLIDIGSDIITYLGNGRVVDAILNRWKNQGRKGVLGCQRDLIDAGYRELAQL